ncbi:MAG: nucleoside kinase [Deltaproteobacteria bacterium]|jgi:uridine kinase|nr:nucleoside kinase [Deltaproteobacteria bacterium]MBW2532268.1 nucleoside kinase [Deltaproteobacteria bacterium]
MKDRFADKKARYLVMDQVPPGTEIRALLPKAKRGPVAAPICALYNNRIVSLSYPMRSGGALRWVTMAERAGWDAYRRSASLMLYEAARRYNPALRLVLHQTHGDALYYDVQGLDQDRAGGASNAVGKKRCQALEAGMRALCREDLPIVVQRISVDEARELLSAQGHEDKLWLLRTHWETSVQIVSCGGFVDLFHSPTAASTGAIRSFRVTPHEEGFLLRVPVRGSAKVRGRPKVGRKLFDTHRRSRAWIGQLGAANLGQLNHLCVSGEIEPLIRVAEGGHEKWLASIADQIASARRRVRVVLVAGPSSSGKTTFVKRLSVQLRVNGLRPVALSVDDFFVPRERTPRDEQGNYDFECLEALDTKLFNEVLQQLLERGEAHVPRYDFHTGKPSPRGTWRKVRLEPDQVVLIEGIHGLNPGLTPAVSANKKFKIYISALTQLSVDDHNRIFTSDTRLLRRIVRDRRYRGYSAAETLRRWPLVRRGEMRHIFPHQEQADVMFNSALVYEHALLRTYAQRYLLEVDERDPAFPEAYRLLGFLRRIVPIFPDAVPQNSILREFVGGSAFSY